MIKVSKFNSLVTSTIIDINCQSQELVQGKGGLHTDTNARHLSVEFRSKYLTTMKMNCIIPLSFVLSTYKRNIKDIYT